jgi:hypothetical protein
MGKKEKTVIILSIVLSGLPVFSGRLWAYPGKVDGSRTCHSAFLDSLRSADYKEPRDLRCLNFLLSTELTCPKGIFSSYPLTGCSRSLFGNKFNFFLNPCFRNAKTAFPPTNLKFSYRLNHRRINYKRAAVMGVGSAAYVYFGLKHAMDIWGKSNGKFHVKDDWTGDHLAQSDEISHFTWGYKMTQLCFWMYDWIGFSPRTSELVSVIESALILTIVEFPVDAYNPQQGLGVSDLIFDYMGVVFAFARKHHGFLKDFDVKVSWKRNLFVTNHPALSQTFGEFDNFIFWLTYHPHLLIPRRFLCVGLGYSVSHRGIEPQREFYGGVGLSVSDFFGLLGKKFESYTRFLDLFYPNFKLKL